MTDPSPLDREDDHFPYKLSGALEGHTNADGRQAVVPTEIATANQRVVDAQAAFLTDPSDENKQARKDAEANLTQIRQTLRMQGRAAQPNDVQITNYMDSVRARAGLLGSGE